VRKRRSQAERPAASRAVAIDAALPRIEGTVRRLTFVPDGGEGQLVATLDDGGGEREARVPRTHARDWAPGSLVVAEGAMRGSRFFVRAYLPRPAGGETGMWIEVAPLPAPSE
jgi:hypothetical protein